MVSIMLSNSHGKLAKQDISVSINNGYALMTPSLICLPIHTVIFCFPPPTLTTPSNPSLTHNFCANQILEMRAFFVERGYLTHLLDSAIQKALSNSRRDTLKPPLVKISDDKIPLVLTFHPFNYKVIGTSFAVIFKFLKNDPEMSAIFTDNPLIPF